MWLFRCAFFFSFDKQIGLPAESVAVSVKGTGSCEVMQQSVLRGLHLHPNGGQGETGTCSLYCPDALALHLMRYAQVVNLCAEEADRDTGLTLEGMTSLTGHIETGMSGISSYLLS